MNKTELIRYVEPACQGDQQAIAQLYNQTYSICFNLIYNICKDKEMSEDVMQEGYFIAFRDLSKLKKQEQFYSWLKTILVRVLYRHMTKEHIPQGRSVSIDDYEAVKDEAAHNENTLQDMAEIKERNLELLEKIYELPEKQRVCVILFYYDGMSVEQIAEELNIPIGSVKSRLHYARARLRSKLSESPFLASNVIEPIEANSRILTEIIAALTEGNTAASTVAVGGTIAARLGMLLVTGMAIGLGGLVMLPELKKPDIPPVATVSASSTASVSMTTTASSSAAETTTTSAATTASTYITTSTTALPKKTVTFDFDEVEGGIRLTHYTGSETDVVIPSRLDGKPVVCIGSKAFYQKSLLTSVSIPGSVCEVGQNAFRRCTGLRSLTIGSGLKRIGAMSFVDCDSLVRVSIPGSVKNIDFYAFAYCDSLKTVTLAEGVESLGYNVFSGCVSLQTVTIPQSVTAIGADVFCDCPDTLTLKVVSGSFAEQYAVDNSINYIC